MTERERLIELITQKQQFGTIIHKNQMDDRVCKSIEVTNAELADYLLENGVITLPCKVGNKVYVFVNWCDYTNCHFEGCAGCLKCNDKGIVERKFNYSMLDDFGKTVFLTREEAEKELKERVKIDL